MRKYLSSYWIRSAIYTFLQRFSLSLFGLVNFLILVRFLTKEQMGTWALFLIVTTIFEVSKSGLLKGAHIRFVSASNEPIEKTNIASSSFIINISISILFILFLLLFSKPLSVWLHGGPELSMMLIYFIPGLIAMVFFSHFEAIQQSHFDFKGVFAGHFIRQLIFFGIIFIHFILDNRFSLVQLALFQSAGIVGGTTVIYLLTRKHMSHKFDPSIPAIKKIFGYGGYIFGSGMLSNIFANVDQVMTATFLTNPAFVAYYNTASRINGFVDIPSYAASEIIFPKVSQASAQVGMEKVKYLYEKMVAILLSFTLPASIFVIAFPNLVISMIAGATYVPAAIILQLYMATGILRPMQNQAANVLNSIGKQKLCFVVNGISLAVNLLVNYICLVQFGLYGAALGTLITSILGAIAWYVIMRKQISLSLGSVILQIRQFYGLVLTRSWKIINKKLNFVASSGT
ncbi:oligosaccharide flippase family protein [Flavitalea antarctica]